MNKSKLFSCTVGAGLLASAVYVLYWRRRPKSVMARMKEPEDVDAYNTDDGQPPLEVQDPRQRSLRR